MTYNGKKVWTQDTFDYDKVQIGDYVEAAIVMDAMDCLPPVCMRRSCAQLGEPHSCREEPETGRWRETYATFKCVHGGWNEGVWEYCGNCFCGETTDRGKDPYIVGRGTLNG